MFENISVIFLERKNNQETDYYELSISEGEEFAIEYGLNAIPYTWVLKNEELLKDSNFQYIGEFSEPPRKGNYGGIVSYYLLFKALNKTNQTKIFHFSFESTGYNNIEILTTAFVKINIFDIKYRDKCINNSTNKCVCDEKNENCESKILCNLILEPSEKSCKEAATPSPWTERCIYGKIGEEPNTQEKCIIKKICIDTLLADECNSAIAFERKKCIFNNEKQICEIKELCEIENSPEKEKCLGIQTSDPIKTKCIYNEMEKKCKIENKTCSEITYGATNEICDSMNIFDAKNYCVLNNETNSCIEIDGDNKIKMNIILYLGLFLLILPF